MLRAEENCHIDNILADPRNSGPRLAYADWLKGQGDRSCEEYLRLQCQQKHFLGQDDNFWEARQGWGDAREHKSGDQCDTAERLRQLEKELDPGWLVWVSEDFAVPPSLDVRGQQAAKIILEVLASHKASETRRSTLVSLAGMGITRRVDKTGVSCCLDRSLRRLVADFLRVRAPPVFARTVPRSCDGKSAAREGLFFRIGWLWSCPHR